MLPDEGEPVCIGEHVWMKYPQVLIPTYRECTIEPCIAFKLPHHKYREPDRIQELP